MTSVLSSANADRRVARSPGSVTFGVDGRVEGGGVSLEQQLVQAPRHDCQPDHAEQGEIAEIEEHDRIERPRHQAADQVCAAIEG